MANNYYFLNYKDINAKTARTKLPIAATILSPSDTVPAAIKTDALACTNASITSSEISLEQYPAGTWTTPSASSWPAIEDRATCEFQTDAQNTAHNIRVPAPYQSFFQTNKNQVALSATAVAAWSLAMYTYAVTKANVAALLVGGTRTKFKPMKR